MSPTADASYARSSCGNRQGAENAQTREEHGELVLTGLPTSPGLLRLPYRRYRRGDQPRPTVFFFGGGPGVSNLNRRPPKSWLVHFDVVLLEYRGVGGSSIVLASPHFATALSQVGGGLSGGHAQPLLQQYRAAFADLRAQGIDFQDFTVRVLADDVEALRQHLGLGQIYLVGHSFGTRVALEYQTRYRAHAAGSVLFALNTPGGFVWSPVQTQAVWTRYAEFLRRHDGRRAAALEAMLHDPSRRARQWGPLRINDAKALFAAFFLAFNAGSRDRVFDAMIAATDGSSWRWWFLSHGYDWLVRYGFNWADFFVKAYSADSDPDLPARLDEQGRYALFQSPSSVLFAGVPAYVSAGGACCPPLEPDYRHTLAVVGEFDPSTPIERQPPDMPLDRWKVVPTGGHADVLYADSEATVGWLHQFLLSPVALQAQQDSSTG